MTPNPLISPVGRMAALFKCRKAEGGGKSGLHGIKVPDNVRRGQPQGKCHRNKPPRLRGKGEKVW